MAGDFSNIIITYKASSGSEYNLKTNGILIREANFHEWSWIPQGTNLQYGQRVSSFSRDAAAYSTKLVFHGPKYVRADLITQLHEEFERDIRNMTPGRVTWGDWYVDCYISDSSTNPATCDWTENDITIFCPRPFWIKEEKKSFLPQDEPPVSQLYLDYEFDYDYDYFLSSIGNSRLVRSFPLESDFKMIIYGPVANPQVSINGYPYKINDTLEATEYLIIDSRNNSIIKFLSNGTSVSIFDKRNKAKSVFERIPGGTLSFSWTGLFGFDLIIYDERSEPLNETEGTTIFDTANISWNGSILMLS